MKDSPRLLRFPLLPRLNTLTQLPGLPAPAASGHPDSSDCPDSCIRKSSDGQANGAGASNAGSKAPDSLWYALYLPQLTDLDEYRQREILGHLAELMLNVSSTVSLHPPSLVCEVRSSLTCLGGIDAIHDRLRKLIDECLERLQLPTGFHHAAAPTVTGSLLLARSGCNVLVYQRANLRSVLGRLPMAILELDKEQQRRLHNMGVRHLRDLWRLPADGLHKRFGSRFVERLHRALGEAPEPTHNYLPAPAFNTACDLPRALENLHRLLPAADEMLALLCDFLRSRDLSTSHLVFTLRHENRPGTRVDIRLRQPGRCRERLLLLLDVRLDNLKLPAPVTGLQLEVREFDAFTGHTATLLDEGRMSPCNYDNDDLERFIEQLQTRFGNSPVKGIDSVAEHCPEYASREFDYREAKREAPSNAAGLNPRPLWLLKRPMRLPVRDGRLYHREAIAIVSGPERIETFRWAGADNSAGQDDGESAADLDTRRDYYVAREQNGSRLWVYRERRGKRNWYLHGLFA